MNLEKAITTSNNLLQDNTSNLIQDEQDAIQLGIEAILRVKYLRELDRRFITMLLPGETNG